MLQWAALIHTSWYLIRLEPDQSGPQVHDANDCSPWGLSASPWGRGDLYPPAPRAGAVHVPTPLQAWARESSVPVAGAGSVSPEARQVRPGLESLEEMDTPLIALNKLSSLAVCGIAGREEICSGSHFEY